MRKLLKALRDFLQPIAVACVKAEISVKLTELLRFLFG
jgi:hypothetical protein